MTGHCTDDRDVEGEGRVQAYASNLFWDDPEAMAEHVAEYIDREYPAVKMHLGRVLTPAEKQIEPMNAAIGDTERMVDINCEDDRADACLHEKLDTPITTGENEFTK